MGNSMVVYSSGLHSAICRGVMVPAGKGWSCTALPSGRGIFYRLLKYKQQDAEITCWLKFASVYWSIKISKCTLTEILSLAKINYTDRDVSLVKNDIGRDISLAKNIIDRVEQIMSHYLSGSKNFSCFCRDTPSLAENGNNRDISLCKNVNGREGQKQNR